MARPLLLVATASLGLALAGLVTLAPDGEGGRGGAAPTATATADSRDPRATAPDWSRVTAAGAEAPASAAPATPRDAVLATIAQPEASAAAQRAEATRLVAASGAAHGAPWTLRAQGHVDAMLVGMRRQGLADVEALGRDCFAAGCVVTLRVGAAGARAPQAVLDATDGWEGERLIFPAEPETGRADSSTLSVVLLDPGSAPGS